MVRALDLSPEVASSSRVLTTFWCLGGGNSPWCSTKLLTDQPVCPMPAWISSNGMFILQWLFWCSFTLPLKSPIKNEATWKTKINSKPWRARLPRRDRGSINLHSHFEKAMIINSSFNILLSPYLGNTGLVLYLQVSGPHSWQGIAWLTSTCIPQTDLTLAQKYTHLLFYLLDIFSTLLSEENLVILPLQIMTSQ